MLRIVARDSAIARGTPIRSPDISTTSALSIATSVPVPMAMPTSASASAGASLTPSPTKATRRRAPAPAASAAPAAPSAPEEAAEPAAPPASDIDWTAPDAAPDAAVEAPSKPPPSASLRSAATLPSGSTSAITSSMPAWRAIARAVRSLSPVIIATLSPIACSAFTAATEVGLSGSATAMIAARRPSIAA